MTNKIMVALISALLIVGAWAMFTTVEARLQTELEQILGMAATYREAGINHRAVQAFSEALGRENNPNVAYELAHIHLELGQNRDYINAIRTLLHANTPPDDMTIVELYLEAFEFYQNNQNRRDQIAFLSDAVAATGAFELLRLYEQERYQLIYRREVYQEAGVITNNMGLVQNEDGLWGFVDATGLNQILPIFDSATHFAQGFTAVIQASEIFLIDHRGLRQAVLPNPGIVPERVANFNGSRFSVRAAGETSYREVTRPSQDIHMEWTDTVYDFIGIAVNNVRAIGSNGVWRLHDASNRNPGVGSDFVYESIAIDEFGRAAVGNVIFVRQNGQYRMIDMNGNVLAEPFDEARPLFESGGLAAVRRGESWGFVNAQGEIVIDFQFENADSSSGRLAPVQQDGYWGYITIDTFPAEYHDYFFGSMAIEPQFLDAKQFVNGTAPVKTDNGWIYIRLLAYE